MNHTLRMAPSLHSPDVSMISPFCETPPDRSTHSQNPRRGVTAQATPQEAIGDARHCLAQPPRRHSRWRALLQPRLFLRPHPPAPPRRSHLPPPPPQPLQPQRDTQSKIRPEWPRGEASGSKCGLDAGRHLHGQPSFTFFHAFPALINCLSLSFYLPFAARSIPVRLVQWRLIFRQSGQNRSIPAGVT
jgi:hypothetical protein